MTTLTYKKMAGTSAVFVSADFDRSSPVERDGLIWSAEELHLEQMAVQRQVQSAMATVLSLEGLEEYNPPQNGDVRLVESIATEFIYLTAIRGWVQLIEVTEDS